MNYEIVTLKEKIAVGISARTNNTSPDAGAVIGGLWNRFYNEGVYASIPGKEGKKAMGIYTDYAGDEKADYTVVMACETTEEPKGEYACVKIPAGRYAKFVVRGDMVQAVGAAWQEIWQMGLNRTFQCDFEEYQDDCMEEAEIHIYVGLAAEDENGEKDDEKCGSGDGKTGAESRCGLLCSECAYREQMNCAGCVHIQKPFWGDSCPVKSCCEEKGLEHCGLCEEFPCGLLNQFAYDKQQGDDGKRIERCRRWRD